MEKVRNTIAIDNQKYPIEDRLMTFDAPEHCVQVGTGCSPEKLMNTESTTKVIKDTITTIVNVRGSEQQFEVQTYQSIIVDKISLYFKRGRHNRVYLVWMGDLHKKDNDRFADDREAGLRSRFRMEKFFKTKPAADTKSSSRSRDTARYEMNFDTEPIQVPAAQAETDQRGHTV